MSNPIKDLPSYILIFQKFLGKRIYIAFFCSLVAAISEGFGIIMLLPLLGNLENVGNSISVPQVTEMGAFTEFAFGFLEFIGFADSIQMVLIIIIIAFCLKGFIAFVGYSYNAYLRGQLLQEVKGKLYHSYSHMDYEYYTSKDTGYFVNLINEQANRSLQSFFYITQLSAQAINAFVYLLLAFLIAWKFGLMAVILGFSVMLLFQWLNSFVRNLSRHAAQENGILSKLMIQALQSYKYLSATNQMDLLGRQIKGSIEDLKMYEVKAQVTAGFTSAAREPIAVIFIFSIIAMQLFYFKQPLAPILVSVLLFYRAMNSLLAFQGYLQAALEYIGGIEMIDEELNHLSIKKEPSGDRKLGVFQKQIELKNVNFGYNDDLKILENLNLIIPAKRMMAIIGPSGAGKSTIIDLLTLSLKPQSGEILIDGINSDEVNLCSWRKQIGYVSQETIVFDDTIANNICLWSGDMHKDENLRKQIIEAARKANLADFISSIPNGFDTKIGDRGLRLSGGQRQRLFIARELFRKPSLLILDEATSALDTESELEIQKSIDNLHGEVTVVIIAHRLATIRNVDTVCVIEDGKLVEQGQFNNLKAMEKSRLRYLLDLQSV